MENSVLKTFQELKDSLSVMVKIDNDQVIKVIVRDLIYKRNHCVKREELESVTHFEYVLKYYLGDDDFKKYVIDSAEIDQ